MKGGELRKVVCNALRPVQKYLEEARCCKTITVKTAAAEIQQVKIAEYHIVCKWNGVNGDEIHIFRPSEIKSIFVAFQDPWVTPFHPPPH